MAARIVYVTSQVRVARIQGEPGEVFDRPCSLCSLPLVAGDAVVVVEHRGVVHAVSHGPDCVEAISRKGTPAR